MELNTLENIDQWAGKDRYVSVTKLNVAVIKWIRETEIILDNYVEEGGKWGLKRVCLELMLLGHKNWYEMDCEEFLGGCRQTIEWIKHFFNRKEEDLK